MSIRIKLGLLLAVVVFGSLVYNRKSAILGTTTSMSASEIMSIVNAVRQQNNLTPLHPNSQLTQAAEAKANAMLAANAWSHDVPNQTPWDFLDQQGYIYSIAGENLAKGFTKPEDVVNSWMNSVSHRENLLNPEYSETGIAVTVGEYQGKKSSTLIVQYLAKPYVLTDLETPPEQIFIPNAVITQMVGDLHPVFFLAGILIFSLTLASAWLFFRVHKLSKKRYILPTSSFWRN